MVDINDFISDFPDFLRGADYPSPWELSSGLNTLIPQIIPGLGADYKITGEAAVHTLAVLEANVTIKGPAIIMANCHICANAYLREGVFLGRSVKIGPGSEIKSSIILSNSAIAHLNYIGNSLIGRHVNFEGGSIAANHYNERADKRIRVLYHGRVLDTRVEKFGALVGDNCKIGANAVLSPGTILQKGSVVKRLELVEQLKLP